MKVAKIVLILSGVLTLPQHASQGTAGAGTPKNLRGSMPCVPALCSGCAKNGPSATRDERASTLNKVSSCIDTGGPKRFAREGARRVVLKGLIAQRRRVDACIR